MRQLVPNTRKKCTVGAYALVVLGVFEAHALVIQRVVDHLAERPSTLRVSAGEHAIDLAGDDFVANLEILDTARPKHGWSECINDAGGRGGRSAGRHAFCIARCGGAVRGPSVRGRGQEGMPMIRNSANLVELGEDSCRKYHDRPL
ncbi:MAG TPA: hypothetical protein VLT33_10070, partial [Labilithrix sp.]|nr:hypothetical protein [Labilithrix sp.]